MRNKFFTRIIITTLLCTFLTFNVGKVTRVSAVGTTIAAAAGATLCAVGIAYCSYMALTGASIHIPDAIDSVETWLTDIGRSVVQYPSGRAAYEELYPELLNVGNEPLTDMLDRAWTWTKEKLISWANDFSSTDVIENIASYDCYIDVSQTPTNTWDYPYSFIAVPSLINDSGALLTFSVYETRYHATINVYDGVLLDYSLSGNEHTMVPTNIHNPVRNAYYNNRFTAQQYVNGTWTNIDYIYNIGGDVLENGRHFSLVPTYDPLSYTVGTTSYNLTVLYDPPFPQERIYDVATGEYIEVEVVEPIERVKNPQWPSLPPDDDNNKYPIIPFVQLPYDPTWVDPVTNVPGGGNWGFNLSELLDTLEDLAGSLMDIGALATLINTFKDLMSSNDYYIYYDDSENNYYQYYTITNYGDNIYNYDINVSDVDEHMPVDLNSLVLYTNNRYLDEIKTASRNGGSLLRDYIVFWYDVAPDIVYLIGGGLIGMMLAAFVGKWGHS